MDETLLDLQVISPRGKQVTVKVRKGTNDGATYHSTFHFDGRCADEYGLMGLRIDGWALDIGASSGPVAIALALDNPGLQVVAVEAVPENAELVAQNVRLAGVADRVHVLPMAAAADGDETATIHYGPYDQPGIPAEHAMQSRFIGNLYRGHGPRGIALDVPAISLSGILERFGIERVRWLKIDCEGCEWAFLDSPSIGLVDEIVGEWHDHPAADIVALLKATHKVELTKDEGGVGLFRAVRKAGKKRKAK